MATKLHTVKEVAALFGVHPQSIYRLIWSGELATVDIGTGKRARTRVRDTAVDDYLKRREGGATSRRRTGATARPKAA